MVFLKEFFQKVNFEKNQQITKKHEKLEFMFMKHYAPNRCEPSIEYRGGGGGGVQGRCERRSEVFVKIQIFSFYFYFFVVVVVGGGGGGLRRVDVNGEVKFL